MPRPCPRSCQTLLRPSPRSCQTLPKTLSRPYPDPAQTLRGLLGLCMQPCNSSVSPDVPFLSKHGLCSSHDDGWVLTCPYVAGCSRGLTWLGADRGQGQGAGTPAVQVPHSGTVPCRSWYQVQPENQDIILCLNYQVLETIVSGSFCCCLCARALEGLAHGRSLRLHLSLELQLFDAIFAGSK